MKTLDPLLNIPFYTHRCLRFVYVGIVFLVGFLELTWISVWKLGYSLSVSTTTLCSLGEGEREIPDSLSLLNSHMSMAITVGISSYSHRRSGLEFSLLLGCEFAFQNVTGLEIFQFWASPSRPLKFFPFLLCLYWWQECGWSKLVDVNPPDRS